MKRIFNGFLMSLNMFSIIPTFPNWDENVFYLIIVLFPFVGILIGFLWYLLALSLIKIGIPFMLMVAILFIFPMFISGFIHIDGYMDTLDAIYSKAERSKKLKILKDPHVGAFSVITLVCYFMIGFCVVYYIMENKNIIAFLFIPAISRSISAIMLFNVKLISKTGFGADFCKNSKPIHTIIIMTFCLIFLIIAYLVGGLIILVTLLAMIIFGILSTIYVVRQFDGISGDLCGFIIAISEICALIALAIGG